MRIEGAFFYTTHSYGLIAFEVQHCYIVKLAATLLHFHLFVTLLRKSYALISSLLNSSPQKSLRYIAATFMFLIQAYTNSSIH